MVVMTAKALGNLHTEVVHEPSGTILQTDAPTDVGGEASSFSPTDLIASGLLSCIMITMGLAANKLRVDLTGMTGRVDKIMTDERPRKIARLVITLDLPAVADADMRAKLTDAAHRCPVHLSLHPDIHVDMALNWAV